MAISRREFLGGGVACIALSALAGCASPGQLSAAGQDDENSVELGPADEVIDTDIVVLGSGMAGLSASIEAAELGAKVVLLEKQPVLGGNTAVSEGVFGVGSRLQAELGITATPNDVLLEEYAFHNFNLNTKLWEIIANESGANIDWLMDHGVEFKTATTPAVGPKVWHVFATGHGRESVDALAAAAEGLGVRIMTSTPGMSLLMDNGTVVGVRGQDDNGSTIDVNAAAVILATGGMAANEDEVLARTNAEAGKFCYLGMEGPTGDAIRLAQEAGMGRPGQVTMCNIGVNVEGLGFFNQFGVCMGMEPTNLWVNQDAERFCPESNTFLMTTAGNSVLSQHKAFSIMDQDSFDRLVNEGPILGQETETVAGVPCQNLQKNVDDALAQGNENVFVADTLEELAEQMGIDAQTLVQTVDEYNGFCDQGVDPRYAKTPEYLAKVATPPFYGARLCTNLLSTFGGIRVNKSMEVVTDGEAAPIPGLYAAGIDCSGFQGETYGIVIAGSTQGVACGTGRIAARSAVDRMNTR